MERLHAIVSGRVQGVMYRDFVQRKGSAFSLLGYVENLADGTVEVLAEGPREKLEWLVDLLHQGPLFADVEHVAVSFEPATGEWKSFIIKYK